MVMPSNRSSSSPPPQEQTFVWRTFLLEVLCGLLTVAWCLLALPEMFLLRALTRLGKAVDSSSDNVSKDVGERSVLPEEAESSFHNAVSG